MGVVLAAGAGRRLGLGPKALVDLDGHTLLEHAVERLRRAGIERVVVVVGADERAAVGRPDVVVAVNPEPCTGPLGSAVAGLRAAGRVDRAVLLPVDHPVVAVDDVRRLVAAAAGAAPGVSRIVPVWEGRRGHPVVVPPVGLAALLAVPDLAATTLRDVLGAAGATVEVLATGPGVLLNVNEPADLEALRCTST